MPFVDLEALPDLVDNIPFWSAKRIALARFKRADFLGDPTQPLIGEVQRRIREETGRTHEGKIYLLANWRYFGYQNNPIACYFCVNPEQELSFVVTEVTNTPWGERHSYVLEAPESNAPLAIEFNKALHVSPFNPMNMIYQWRSTVPDDTLAIQLTSFENGQRIFDATLSLQSEPFNRHTLMSAILRFPFMTMKVGLSIYWQALLLWLKKTPVHHHPKSG